MIMNTKEEGRADVARRFDPLELGGIEFRNRLSVAPMTRVSAAESGQATDRVADDDGAFAEGRFELVITEGVYSDQVSATLEKLAVALGRCAEPVAHKTSVLVSRSGVKPDTTRVRGEVSRAVMTDVAERIRKSWGAGDFGAVADTSGVPAVKTSAQGSLAACPRVSRDGAKATISRSAHA